jgi:hypothetical protein
MPRCLLQFSYKLFDARPAILAELARAPLDDPLAPQCRRVALELAGSAN